MGKFRVKIKEDNRLFSTGVTWELQRHDDTWDDPALVDMRDDEEWQYQDFGEAKTRDEAIADATQSMHRIQEEERIDAEADYVLLD